MVEGKRKSIYVLEATFAQAQTKMKLDADKNRTHREFGVGESVFLKLQSYAQQFVVNRPFPKLAMKFLALLKSRRKLDQQHTN